MVGRAAVGAASVGTGLLALFYVTNFFESLMHSSTSLFSGQSPSVAAGTGVLIGGLHTLAGPDHFAALMPLVIGQNRSPVSAFGLGALWGSGHALGQLLLGLGCLAVQHGLLRFRWTSSLTSSFGQVSDVLVGGALVAIGLLGLNEARQFDQEAEEASKERFGLATFATGVVHGLAPDGIIFLAPALALPRIAALCHVTGVFSGTFLSMGFCTALLSALCRRSPRLKFLSGVASAAAMLLGASILLASIGISVPLPALPGL